jgi:hypothetical protein
LVKREILNMMKMLLKTSIGFIILLVDIPIQISSRSDLLIIAKLMKEKISTMFGNGI